MHNEPLPIGYVEVQTSWVGSRSAVATVAILHELQEKTRREYPQLMEISARLESTLDGAGVPHYTFYLGYAPPVRSSEPLDPRNLGGAPNSEQIGDPVRDFSVGMKEQKF
jgi:hypothetical protein